MSREKNPSVRAGQRRLSAQEQELVRREEQLAEQAQATLRAALSQPDSSQALVDDYYSLRQQAHAAKEGDLAAALANMHLAYSRVARMGPRNLPDPQEPYFAHLRLQLGERQRDVLIGYRSFVDTRQGVSIVDWRTAPVAKVFYNYAQGEDFDEDFPAGPVEGKVLVRHLVSFDQEGRLATIVTPCATYRLGEKGWTREALSQSRLSSASVFGTGLTGNQGPAVSALLDRKQHQLIQKNPEASLLVLGSAGCGKTTVALHRLASQLVSGPTALPSTQALVIVPQPGLARLSRTLLAELRVDEVPVQTFEEWVTAQTRRVFPKSAKQIRDDAPPLVARFKRHPALRPPLRQYVEQQGRALALRLDRQLGAQGRLEAIWQELPADVPLLERLTRAQRALETSAPECLPPETPRVFDTTRQRLFSVQGDLVRVLGDDLLVARVIEASQGQLPAHTADEVRLHLRRQLAPTAEERFADVDPEKLRTLDGRGLDEGTPDELASSMDLEDSPLLFELLWLKTGRLSTPAGQVKTWKLLVLDEAQELAEVELALLGRARRPQGTFTIAGDEAQHVDPSAFFISWEHVVATLGVGEVEPVVLHTNYRSTREIAQFGQEVLGPLAPPQPPTSDRAGGPVLCSLFHNEGHRALVLMETLAQLTAREPRARVAVITREPELATQIFEVLRQRLPVRLALHGEFTFKPGIDVTEVAQVKGLEFDYVVLPDVAAGVYPATSEARRALHVAATRAIHQIWLLVVGPPSSLLAQVSLTPGPA